MIFSDQETAKEVRAEAERQLIDWLFKQNMDLLDAMGIILKTDAHAIDEESIRNNAISNIETKLPSLIATLLYKSGIIGSAHDGVHPVVLNFDDDNKNNYELTQAFGDTPGRLIGGLLDGRIHT